MVGWTDGVVCQTFLRGEGAAVSSTRQSCQQQPTRSAATHWRNHHASGHHRTGCARQSVSVKNAATPWKLVITLTKQLGELNYENGPRERCTPAKDISISDLTIVEYCDYQCVPCKKVNLVLQQICS
jgi:hypothetical protein